jgi:cysteine desulfurase/selenocysteine lyase
MYENARMRIARFFGIIDDSAQVIFTKGATEALNLVAYSLGEICLESGDEIVITDIEHHANLVPWQELARRKHASLSFMPISALESVDEIDEKWLAQYITPKSKIVAFTGMSNVLGTIMPVERIGSFAQKMGARVVLDAAQLASHAALNLEKLPIDFAVAAGHKMLGPTGIGILFGRRKLLEMMPPYQTGGDMIWRVTKEKSTWGEIPAKFEAGTPPIAEAIGLGAAIDYLTRLGMDKIHEHELNLVKYTLERLKQIEGVTIYGDKNPANRGGVISFNIQGVHPHDVGTIVARDNIAMRVGHHCCQVLMKELNVAATCRVSFYLYNNFDDIDRFIETLDKVKEIFHVA